MFDNLFSPSPQVWAGLVAGLIALPILIHLINLMRHQKVEWAAMEFLLKSYKKNRNWVWLKQFLLLLSRIAALLLALFMLAQIGCNEDRLARLLGGNTTHHYVLLDDSFSMSERGAQGSAFDRALTTVSQVGTRAKNRQNQKFTLLRFSRSSPGNEGQQISVADLNGELVDSLFPQRLEETKTRLTVSNFAVGIENALASVAQLIQQRESENSIVYVLSDFRKKDWDNVESVQTTLKEISDTGAVVEMINCANSDSQNLAVVELSPSGSVRVAGTPLMMNLKIKNCSTSTAEKVQVQIDSYTFAEIVGGDKNPEDVQASVDELPTVFIEKIGPGQVETRQFPVFFNQTGNHAVKATLKNDAIRIDNECWATTKFSNSANVLIVEPTSRSDGRFLALAMNPGGMTGITPTFKPPSYLRDATLEQLNEFDVIFLLDLEKVDESAITVLESYATSGGGVGFFLGPNSNPSFITNQLYRSGDGIFPLPLEKSIDVPELIEDRVPDISLEDHPLIPDGMKNPLLDLVQIKKVIQPPVDWLKNKKAEVSLVATIRGIDTWPLLVQSRFGKGNVIAFTSTAGPTWNNWGRNGTFPPIMLLLQDFLARGRYPYSSDYIGVPIELSVDSKSFGPELAFIAPMENRSGSAPLSRLAGKRKMELDAAGDVYQLSIGKDLTSGAETEISTPGIYDLWLQNSGAELSLNRFALNPDTRESELERVNKQALIASFDNSQISIVNWDQFNPEPKQQETSSLTKLLLFVLGGLLILESVLAYSASYHAKPQTLGT